MTKIRINYAKKQKNFFFSFKISKFTVQLIAEIQFLISSIMIFKRKIKFYEN